MLDLSQQQVLTDLIQGLVAHDLSLDSVQQKCEKGARGSHLPCIIGYQRQYQKASFVHF